MTRMLTALISILFVLVMPVFGAAASETRTIKVGLYQSPTHEISVWVSELEPMLAKISDGRLQLKIYDAGTIAKGKEMVDAVQRDLVDVGFVFPGFNSATFPLLEFSGSVPFLFRNDHEWWKAMPKVMPIVQSVLAEKGYDNIALIPVPYYGGWYKIATSGKPVRVPVDLAGMKVKAVGRGMRAFVESAGGSALSLPTGQVYEAASRGLLQGSVGVHTHWTGWRQMEVFDYLLDLPVAPTTMLFYVNKQTLDELGPELTAILQNYLEFVAATMTVNSMVSEAKNEQVISSHMTLYRPSEQELELWYDLSRDVIDDWVERSAPYGQQVVDVIEKARKSERKNFRDY